ncbi:MAG: porin family protein [Phycisphaerae bacterium]|nr:porin family protein [Phycisphaerae bacterium]
MPRRSLTASAAFLAGFAGAAHASDAGLFAPAAFAYQRPGEPPEGKPKSGPPEGSEASLAVGGMHTFRSDFDDDSGKIGVTRADADVGFSIAVAEHRWVDLGIFYERSWYQFDGVSGFGEGVTEPWDDVQSLRLSLGYRVGFNATWSYSVAGFVDSSAEDGAEFGDSLTFGGLAGFGYKVNDNLELGLGLLVASRLEDDPWIIPLPRVDWKLGEKVRLRLGGARAGGALAWEFSDALTLALEASYRSREFRLEEMNPAAPEGVGRDRQVPVGLALTWKACPNASIGVRAGYVLWQEYEVLDRAGNRLVEKDADAGPYLGASLRLSF